jgi:hypothetical protein
MWSTTSSYGACYFNLYSYSYYLMWLVHEIFRNVFLNAGLAELRLKGEHFLISDVGIYLGLGFENLRKMDIDFGQRVSLRISYMLPIFICYWEITGVTEVFMFGFMYFDFNRSQSRAWYILALRIENWNSCLSAQTRVSSHRKPLSLSKRPFHGLLLESSR